MAEKTSRRALGRGLAELLGDAPPAAERAGVAEVPVADIRPNAEQPRRTMDPGALESLVSSIRTSGLVQPVVVRRLPGGGYELIAGERRWRAAQAAGLERIPALVRDADERERLELALIENVVREDLNAIEVARALAVLVEDFGQTHGELGERLGRSRPTVANLVRLLELPDDVQAMVADGRLTEGHARAVLQADSPASRRMLAARIVEEELTVRQAEEAARRATRRPASTRERPPLEAGDRAADVFYGRLGATTKTRAARGGAVVVELRFPSHEALQTALDRLSTLTPEA